MQDLTKTVDNRLLSTFQYDHSLVVKLIDVASDLAVNLVVAAIIAVVTFWAARWLSRLARAGVAKVHRRGDSDTTLQSFVGSLVRYIIVIVGFVAVLQQLGVQTTSVLAVLGAASLAIGLALQGALSNVAAGVMILLFRPYRVGDTIETSTRKGVVRALDLFTTELATPDNLKVVVPNSKVFGDVIVNFSHHPRRRCEAVFRLPFAADAEAILGKLRDRVTSDPRARKDPPPSFEMGATTHDAVELAIKVWAAREDEGAMKSDIIRAAHILALDINGKLPPLTPAAPRAKPAERAARRRLRLIGRKPSQT